MSRIYWDSMLFIYLFEGNPSYTSRVTTILSGIMQRGDTLCTSVFTMGEVLVGPRKAGFNAGVKRAREFFLESGEVELISFTNATADRYSIIRAGTSIKAADVIHLACAAESGVELFITHDKSLQKLTIPGIHFITGLDTSLF
ncbi:MAG TPA: PIN domain-containing protein [Terracidiphilus sp.]|jgi:predicted nucleic acid-binding protein|nr:PIN domain-containing protein [Terracidiphilus sp.]